MASKYHSIILFYSEFLGTLGPSFQCHRHLTKFKEFVSLKDCLDIFIKKSFWIRMRLCYMATKDHSIIFFLISGTDQRRTKYGCEGSELELECEEGAVINLVRANYGRFSISICNPEGNTAYSVNCMEPRTLRLINNRYEDKNGLKTLKYSRSSKVLKRIKDRN